MKLIKVTISQTLSTTEEIEVNEDFDTSNEEALKEIIEQDGWLPSDLCPADWNIDDFCVVYENEV